MKYASLLKASVAATVLLAGLGAASAADAPIYDKGVVAAPVMAPVYMWQGFYGGLFAGYAWGEVDVEHPTTVIGTTAFPYYFPGAGYELDDSDGFFGGGQLGYNWQSGTFVFGIEAELGYLGLDGDAIDPNGVATFGWSDLVADVDSDFYGALTARLGFATDQLLVYAKGGAAFLNSDVSFVDGCVAPATVCDPRTYAAVEDDWQGGWTIGGGAEWAFGTNWSAKVEYMYFDFGDTDVAAVASDGFTYTGNFDLTAHTVKLGVNYRF